MGEYVILQWSQDGGRPTIAIDAVYATLAEAQDMATQLSTIAARFDRRDAYCVHVLGDEIRP